VGLRQLLGVVKSFAINANLSEKKNKIALFVGRREYALMQTGLKGIKYQPQLTKQHNTTEKINLKISDTQ
jgi:hypothetical protein